MAKVEVKPQKKIVKKKSIENAKREGVLHAMDGKEVGNVIFPEGVFDVPWNSDLVHQVVTAHMMTSRANTAHTKSRGEVRGGGKKPWQQKGTGRSRHGSRRSPIWVGGGVAHGPRNDKNTFRKVNKKMKERALLSVLSKKFTEGEIFFVKDIKIGTKTKEAVGVMNAMKSVSPFKKRNSTLIAMSGQGTDLVRAFKNIGSVKCLPSNELHVSDVLEYKSVWFLDPENSLKTLKK